MVGLSFNPTIMEQGTTPLASPQPAGGAARALPDRRDLIINRPVEDAARSDAPQRRAERAPEQTATPYGNPGSGFEPTPDPALAEPNRFRPARGGAPRFPPLAVITTPDNAQAGLTNPPFAQADQAYRTTRDGYATPQRVLDISV